MVVVVNGAELAPEVAVEHQIALDLASDAHWLVLDHPFNLAWYPRLVGLTGLGAPPSYARVRLRHQSEPFPSDCSGPFRPTPVR